MSINETIREEREREALLDLTTADFGPALRAMAELLVRQHGADAVREVLARHYRRPEVTPE